MVIDKVHTTILFFYKECSKCKTNCVSVLHSLTMLFILIFFLECYLKVLHTLFYDTTNRNCVRAITEEPVAIKSFSKISKASLMEETLMYVIFTFRTNDL